MHIGLDFDNTIVLYDKIFYNYAIKIGCINKEISKTKEAVRSYLINSGEEELFTKIQGEVYGQLISNAPIQKGLIEAIKNLTSKGCKFSIVSHKTKYPIIGKKFDLHQAALNWLKKNGLIGTNKNLIKRENIYFEETFQNKIERINSIECNVFIDDLVKVLDQLGDDILKIHFSKGKSNSVRINDYEELNDWRNLSNIINLKKEFNQTKTLDEQYSYMFNENYIPSTLGKVAYARWTKDPKTLLFSLSRYKFVSKIMEGRNNLLEAGCGDGWCSGLVAKSVRKLTLTDYDSNFVKEASKTNKNAKNISYKVVDFINQTIEEEIYDGFYCLDVLEHIDKKYESKFIANVIASCKRNSIFVFGMPSIESQSLIQIQNRDPGHINCKTKTELKKSMEEFFEVVITFSMNDEIVHTGHGSMAYYIFAICSMPKSK